MELEGVKKGGILAFPPELIAEIFAYACTYEISDQRNDRQMRQPTVLAHVCRLWRNVAINYSSIWTFIFWSSHKTDQGHLLTHLERSKSSKIDICLHIVAWSRRLDTAVFQLLLKHQSRWNSFSIDSVDRGAFPKIFDNLLAPNLKVLNVTHSGSSSSPFSYYPEDPDLVLKGVPALEHLRLHGFFIPLGIHAHLANLVTLSVESSSLATSGNKWSVFLKLVQLPRLASLSIGIGVFNEPDERTTLKITSPSLKSLRLIDSTVSRKMWSYLEAPNLVILALRLCSLDGLAIAQDAASTFPKLRDLYIVDLDPDTTEDDVLALAKATSTITFLSICDNPNDPSLFMDHIVPTETTATTLWPHLEILKYSGYPNEMAVKDMADFFLSLARLVMELHKAGLAVLVNDKEPGAIEYIPEAPFNPGKVFDDSMHVSFRIDE